MQNFIFQLLTLSTQDNAKLLKQLKPGLKTGININQKCQQKDQTNIWDYLIDSCFQGVNRLFVLPFENEAQ